MKNYADIALGSSMRRRTETTSEMRGQDDENYNEGNDGIDNEMMGDKE